MLTLDGSRTHDIRSFYDEIDRDFMTDVDWTPGASLDALDDMLRGGYSALHGDAPVALVWIDFDKSRSRTG